MFILKESTSWEAVFQKLQRCLKGKDSELYIDPDHKFFLRREGKVVGFLSSVYKVSFSKTSTEIRVIEKVSGGDLTIILSKKGIDFSYKDFHLFIESHFIKGTITEDNPKILYVEVESEKYDMDFYIRKFNIRVYPDVNLLKSKEPVDPSKLSGFDAFFSDLQK